LNETQTATSLPNYFWAQQKGNVPATFSALEHLIGDVNPEFFANQVGLVLEQAETGKIRKQNTIFFQSLVQTGVLNDQGQLLIEQVPTTAASYQKNLAQVKDLVPEFTDSLKKIKYCQELLTALIKHFELAGITYLSGNSKE
jgi:NifB/MoaA-like Fe-S oxidoreductase